MSPRNRRPLPEERVYIQGVPTENDVMADRGARTNLHPGNIPYWRSILAHRETYRESRTDEEKHTVALGIVDSIKRRNGRFLQKEKEVGERWFVLPDNIVTFKVKQALRDAYIPKWARKGLRVRIKDHIDFEGRDKTGVIVEESNEKEWILILDDGEVLKICKKCQKRCISTSGQQEQLQGLPKFLVPRSCKLCDRDILSLLCSESD